MEKNKIILPKPCIKEVKNYLKKWDSLENYVLQENSLNKVFLKLLPKNDNIEDILIKASMLNDFYSTNIFSIFPVAKHIYQLNIDKRLNDGDSTLVNDISNIVINGKHKTFYSFATKYCSHHQPNEYPIYDSYVEKVLLYFRNRDSFYNFNKEDLKDYVKFKSILIKFSDFYKLNEFNLKNLDRYLWQLGKEYFPKKY